MAKLAICLPINNIVLVQMLQCQHQLGDVEPSPLLREPCLLLQMPKELSSTLEVSDEIQVRVCLEGKLQADEEWTVQRPLENLTLSDGVGYFLLCDDLTFGEDFHRIDTFGISLPDLEDSAEGASTNKLEEFEVSWSKSTLGL